MATKHSGREPVISARLDNWTQVKKLDALARKRKTTRSRLLKAMVLRAIRA